MKLLCVVFLLSTNVLFAQEHMKDTLLNKHAELVLKYFENVLNKPQSQSAMELAYARAAEDYGYNDKAKKALKAYLAQKSQDAEARIDYALLLSRGDANDRLLATIEADSAKNFAPQDLNVLAGVLTITLVRLDSDFFSISLDTLREKTEIAAKNLLGSSKSQNTYLTHFADSTLRWLKHYDDNQRDLDEQAGNEYESIDKELNRVYHAILRDYDDDTVFTDRFKDAELAWLLFRDAEMKAIFPYADSNGNYYGSVFPMCESEIAGFLEQSRLKEIMTWYNGESEGDVCSGSIKTPEELAEIRSGNKKNK